MLLVQDQLATAGPKPNKQEKYYEIEVENNHSILNQTIHKQSGTFNLLSSKDFVDVGFDGKGHGGGGPGDQGSGGGGPGNGGPRSKDYGSLIKSSKRPDNTSAAQENRIPQIISLDLEKNLAIKKAPQLIIDKEELSIKPQIKKPAKPKLTPIDQDVELPDESNSLFPDILSYRIDDDKTTRKISSKSTRPKLNGIVIETKPIPLRSKNTSLDKDGNSFKAEKHPPLDMDQNKVAVSLDKINSQEVLVQPKSQAAQTNVTTEASKSGFFGRINSLMWFSQNSEDSKSSNVKKEAPQMLLVEEKSLTPPSSPRESLPIRGAILQSKTSSLKKTKPVLTAQNSSQKQNIPAAQTPPPAGAIEQSIAAASTNFSQIINPLFKTIKSSPTHFPPKVSTAQGGSSEIKAKGMPDINKTNTLIRDTTEIANLAQELDNSGFKEPPAAAGSPPKPSAAKNLKTKISFKASDNQNLDSENGTTVKPLYSYTKGEEVGMPPALTPQISFNPIKDYAPPEAATRETSLHQGIQPGEMAAVFENWERLVKALELHTKTINQTESHYEEIPLDSSDSLSSQIDSTETFSDNEHFSQTKLPDAKIEFKKDETKRAETSDDFLELEKRHLNNQKSSSTQATKGLTTSQIDEISSQTSDKTETVENAQQNQEKNEKSKIQQSAQDGQMFLEISKPVSDEISNQTKVQNYANRITLVSLQLQALQAIEHHIDTWSSTTLTSLTPSAALPAAGEYDEEESFSPLTQIMKKGTLVPWILGHYGKSIQGKVKDRAAYRADLGGFSIGSDLVLNECTVLGISYTKITSKVKYRQDRLGDKATTDSQTFALYGQYNISDTLFAQSAISYTKGLTKHNYINQESYKSSSRGFAGFVTLNNVFALSKNTFIVPRVGLRYIENKEKDTQVGNAKITGARNHYLIAILGSKILFRKDLGDVSITPGLYAGLEQPIVTKNKGAKASIIEAGQTFEYQAPASKSKNMTYNLGAEISAKRKNLVLSLSYQCSLAKKYANHQGTLKIGLAF